MEYCSALTLKPFDTITIPGLGTKRIGAIHQTGDYEYQLRLDGKFVASVTVDVPIASDEQRSPERHEGPWHVRQQARQPAPDPQRERWLDAVAQEALLAGLEGRPFTMPTEPEWDTHGAAPGDKHLSDAEAAASMSTPVLLPRSFTRRRLWTIPTSRPISVRSVSAAIRSTASLPGRSTKRFRLTWEYRRTQKRSITKWYHILYH